MFLCTYMHTYMHTYIRTYIHIHTHTYTTYIHTYIHTYMHTYIHTYIHKYIHRCTLQKQTTQLKYGHSSLRVYLTGEYIYIRNKKTLFPFLDMPVNCSDAKETYSKRYTLKSNEQRVDLVGGHLSSKNHAVYL